MSSSEQGLVFEYPTEERIRNYLRLEFLFQRFHRVQNESYEDSHHFALLTLFEIVECATKGGLKLEILKDLERQKKSCPQFNDELCVAIENLQKIQHKIGQNIRECNWLVNIKQRITVPGGTSSIDIPSYYLWRNLSFSQRQEYLQQWASTLEPTGEAISLLMKILRQNQTETECVADHGNYILQSNHQASNIHLMAVKLDSSFKKVMPEISANKYMLHIRFIDTDFCGTRGTQVDYDVPFKLVIYNFD